MSAKELVGLNQNLGEQLDRILPKHALMRAIIAENLKQDAELRSVVESVKIAVNSRKILNDPRFAWMVRRLTAEAKDAYPIDDRTEEGIKSCARRLTIISNLLAMIGRLNAEKEMLRGELLAARERSRIEIKYLKGQKDWARMAEAMRTAVDYAAERIKAIAEDDRKIEGALEAIMKESQLMLHDLEHKYDKKQYADPKMKEEILSAEQQAFLAEHEAELEAVRKMNSGYLPVYGSILVKDTPSNTWVVNDFEIGEALPYDIKTLELRDKPRTPNII